MEEARVQIVLFLEKILTKTQLAYRRQESRTYSRHFDCNVDAVRRAILSLDSHFVAPATDDGDVAGLGKRDLPVGVLGGQWEWVRHGDTAFCERASCLQRVAGRHIVERYEVLV